MAKIARGEVPLPLMLSALVLNLQPSDVIFDAIGKVTLERAVTLAEVCACLHVQGGKLRCLIIFAVQFTDREIPCPQIGQIQD
jgi:hypothetical protein